MITAAFKEQLHYFLSDVLAQKISMIKKEMQLSNESLETEGRSTAGDKHNTSRAMAHLEQEKLSERLQQAEKMYAYLNSLSAISNMAKAGSGALIETKNDIYYLSVGLGFVNFNGTEIKVISSLSPIGKILMNAVRGDKLKFRDQQLEVVEII